MTSDDVVDNPPYRMLTTPAPQYASRAATPQSPQLPNYFSPPKSNTPQPNTAVIAEYEDSRDRSYSVNSIASLGSFPAPPTHFPLPPINSATNAIANRLSNSQSSSEPSSAQPLSEESPASDVPAETTPALPAKMRKDSATFLDFSSPPGSPPALVYESPKAASLSLAALNEEIGDARASTSGTTTQDKAQHAVMPSGPRKSSATYSRGDYIEEEEDRRMANASPKTGGSVATIAPAAKPLLERSDTNQSRSSSVVAAMRDKYSRSVNIQSQLRFYSPDACI